jgi:hypothetical protein
MAAIERETHAALPGVHFPRLAVMGAAHGIGEVILLGVHLVICGLQLGPKRGQGVVSVPHAFVPS